LFSLSSFRSLPLSPISLLPFPRYCPSYPFHFSILNLLCWHPSLIRPAISQKRDLGGGEGAGVAATGRIFKMHSVGLFWPSCIYVRWGYIDFHRSYIGFTWLNASHVLTILQVN
jgi:hypothetical protein